jgi:hypothetical protein
MITSFVQWFNDYRPMIRTLTRCLKALAHVATIGRFLLAAVDFSHREWGHG